MSYPVFPQRTVVLPEAFDSEPERHYEPGSPLMYAALARGVSDIFTQMITGGVVAGLSTTTLLMAANFAFGENLGVVGKLGCGISGLGVTAWVYDTRAFRGLCEDITGTVSEFVAFGPARAMLGR